jgi:hypothetical protein
MKEKIFLLLIFMFVPVVVYWPAFTHEFGMHNDYRMLEGSFQDRKIFDEAEHLYVVGRPLQYWLITWQSWFIQKTSDFVAARIVQLFLLWFFLALFYRFLRRHLELEAFWATLLTINVAVLPPSQLYVIFLTELLPGFFTLIPALTSYLLLDSASGRMSARESPRRIRRAGLFVLAFLLFLTALLTYPMNAVFVFFCTFGIVLFSKPPEWRETVKIVARDIIFFGAGMLVYFLLIVFYFLPHQPVMASAHDLEKTEYNFSVGFNLLGKANLVRETFLTALGGVWHSIFLRWGVLISATLMGVIGILWVFLFLKASKRRGKVLNQEILPWFGLIATGMMLFIFANSPTIIAKGCFKLVGYRVIFPASVIILMVQWGLLRKIAELLSSKKNIYLLRGIGVVVLVLQCCLATKNVADAARNYSLELSYLRQQLKEADLKDKERIMLSLVPPYAGETLLERAMANEFALMITGIGLANPIVCQALQERGLKPLPVSTDDSNIVYYDQYTQVIDINQARAVYQKVQVPVIHRPFAFVTSSDADRRHIHIYQDVGGIYFLFQEDLGENRLPFWLIQPAAGIPWIQFEFRDAPQKIFGFTFGVYALAQSPAIPTDFRLQASEDGKRWVDLKTALVLKKGDEPNLAMYALFEPTSHRMFRFYFVPRNFAQPLPIAKIHLVFKI